MIKDLVKLATRLDKLGLTKEADVLDAAAVKLAQQVATTGVAGATYSAGRQVTPGTPGGAVVKFYKAKPKSISEFNAFLGALIKDVAEDPRQSAFSAAIIANVPTKSDTSWNSKTAAAFKEYAVAAGFPEAGRDWQKFAKSNKYEPTMYGIFKFWEDTIEKVSPSEALQATLNRNMPTEGSKGPLDVGPTSPAKIDWGTTGPGYDPLNPLADLTFLTPEQRGESAAAGGSSMSVSKPIAWSASDLWRDGTFENNDPLNGQLWRISDADKQKLADLFSKDPVAQAKAREILSRNPGKNKGELVGEFEGLLRPWYRGKLKELGIKGYYPARAGSGDPDPMPEAIPAGADAPPVKMFDPARARALNKGLISR